MSIRSIKSDKNTYEYDDSHKLSGGNGIVYFPKNFDNIVIKYCKYTKNDKYYLKDRAVRFDNEIKFLCANNFDFMPKLYDFCIGTEKEHSWFVMEKCLPLLEGFKKGTTFKFRLEICLKLLEIIKILHDNNFAHRDIKPSNLLFRDGILSVDNLLLSDYGLVSTPNGEKITNGYDNMGSNTFTAPEARYKSIHEEPEFYKPSDIYSFGKTVWAILKEQEHSFEYDEKADDLKNKFQDKETDNKHYFLEPLYEMIEKSTMSNRELRIGIKECELLLRDMITLVDHPDEPIINKYKIKQIVRMNENILQEKHNDNDNFRLKTFESSRKIGNFILYSGNDRYIMICSDKKINSKDDILYDGKLISPNTELKIKFIIDHFISDADGHLKMYILYIKNENELSSITKDFLLLNGNYSCLILETN